MKKSVVFILALITALTMAAMALAENLDSVEMLARQFVPDGATFVSREMDDGQYELNFRVRETKEKFEVHISKDGQMVTKVSSEIPDDRGSKNVTLTEAAAMEKVVDAYPGTTVETFLLIKDDGYYEYQVTFQGNGTWGKIALHPETGLILEREVYYTAGDFPSDSTLLDVKRAEEIALQKAGSGKLAYIKLEQDDGRQVFEGEIIADTYEYEFEIDAQSGKILEWEKDRLGN